MKDKAERISVLMTTVNKILIFVNIIVKVDITVKVSLISSLI